MEIVRWVFINTSLFNVPLRLVLWHQNLLLQWFQIIFLQDKPVELKQSRQDYIVSKITHCTASQAVSWKPINLQRKYFDNFFPFQDPARKLKRRRNPSSATSATVMRMLSVLILSSTTDWAKMANNWPSLEMTSWTSAPTTERNTSSAGRSTRMVSQTTFLFNYLSCGGCGSEYSCFRVVRICLENLEREIREAII